VLAGLQVAKTSHWEIMLLEAAQYESPVLDMLLVTDKADALRRVVDRMQLPLNISYYQAEKPSNDSNKYWLAWEHRKAVQEAVSQQEYTAVVYMEVINACTASSLLITNIIDMVSVQILSQTAA
jgi:hypothetical protein